MNPTFKVAGIGELLWDVFPDHKRIGGAPANFAYHTHQLGAESWPVSCIGSDALGIELRGQLIESGVDVRYVKESASHPTGTVDVVLHSGKPTYEIHENVAWDHLPFTADLRELAGQLDAVCFGSLSQRSTESSQSIHAFLSEMPEHALKIFDVNVRQSFYSKELIRKSLKLANVLKLSDEELPVLLDLFDLGGDSCEQLVQLRKLFDLRLVAYTRGSHGSLLVTADSVHDFPGMAAEVVDTVGAGDSFTAALCMGTLRGWPLGQVNDFANRVAAYVCSQKGATPAIPNDLLQIESSI
ncbi:MULTISPECIES: carbohydrate kinase [unclassified Lentimonas]|uniref:carbohydrate kinase family protein n=1 Tax=unclassified Lentimonas TaxID=2630993 RepID=UPI0013284ED7|nr:MULTISPECIES: carbohydrate kinase [unclassified Lentimonas]CAA6689642.1 Fructokinase (EC [Lentimonas sp. CC19]CAA6692636.1 Fructokinase (EC [Lentimonas sp. CC10]CAA7069232.1 Fructokinase (EC [Lentimonas sp. CC11]